MTPAYLIQTLASLVAILVLAGLAWWARIARPTPELDEAMALRLVADEFPDHAMGPVFIDADRHAAVVRSGEEALVLYRLGDGYVARALPWTRLSEAQTFKTKAGRGGMALRFADVAAPRARFALADGAVWPPVAGA